MNTSEKKEFNNLLVGTFEVYGTKLTAAAIMIWANSMDKYSFSDLKNALSYHIQSSPFAPKPSDLIHIIQAQDGRPSADEAWGMIPRNESVSAIRLGRISETHGRKLLPQITNWTELMRLS